MRGSNDEDEPSGVELVGWALFLLVVAVAMALIVSASIETALAPPMSPSAPGEVQLTAVQSWIVVAILLAIEGFFLLVLLRHLLVLGERFGWRAWAFRASRIRRSRAKG